MLNTKSQNTTQTTQAWDKNTFKEANIWFFTWFKLRDKCSMHIFHVVQLMEDI